MPIPNEKSPCSKSSMLLTDYGESGEREPVISREDPGLPIHRAAFVIAKTAIGAGMLNFPQAYGKTGGIAQALALQAVIIVLIMGSFLILGFCGEVKRTSNYQDMIFYFCGPVAQIICQVIVVIFMFGSNVAYLILVGDQFIKVIDHPGWYFDRRFIIAVVSCTFILPLCIPKKLKVLSYASILGTTAALFVCVVVTSRYYSGKYTFDSSSKPFRLANAFAGVPVFCFSYMCHVASVAVLGELHNPTMKRFGIVTTLSTLLCTVVYTLTGVYGFLTFGYSAKSDILVNYDAKDKLVTAARAVIVLIESICYAITLFVGRSAFIGLWIKLRKLKVAAEVNGWEDKRRIITTLVWFFASLALAIVVPTIEKPIDVVGAVSALFIFTFPGLCLIQAILNGEGGLSRIKRNAGLIVGVVYVVIGTLLFGQAITQTLMSDFENE